MAEYGFTINVSGNSVAELKRIEGELSRLGIMTREAGKDAAKAMEPFDDKLKDLAIKLGELFAIREIFNFGKEILNVTAEFEGFENRIKFASLNTYDAAENMSFLREEVEKLHMPMRQAYEGFSEMQAGLSGTGIEGQRLRDLFEGISTAAATLHLPEYNLQRTLLDFKEIGEIGLNRRIYRSLGTALPGINSVIREAFGKSFDELEKSGISGTEFLAKIGPALKQHFEHGLANWSESLQAKLADMKNAATQTMLGMGQRLEPIFKNILDDIREAFNSAPVQFFIQHIDTIATVLARIIPMWAAYKGIMILVNSAMTETGILFRIIEGAQMVMMFGFEGLEVAAEGFGVTLASIGIGVFAAALALVVEGFINMNKELDDAVDKITNLNEITKTFEQFAKSYKEDDLAFGTLGSMNDQEKGEYAAKLKSDIAAMHKHLTETVQPQLASAREAYKNMVQPKRLQGETDVEYSGRLEEFWRLQKRTEGSIHTLSETMSNEMGKMVQLQADLKAVTKDGLKPLKDPPLVPTGTVGGLHGSHLSGAEGGLNQARIVNLKIDKVMEVHEAHGPDLVKHAEHAADFIIRAMDNMSENKTGTF